MACIPAIGYIGLVLICAIVAYFTIVRKMDHNLQLRNVVFRVIVSFLLGTATLSIFSQLISTLMISTRAYENIASLYCFQLINMMLFLGIVAAYYWGIRTISMSFGYSHKQYQTIKLITAFMLGCIAKEVLQLILVIVLFLVAAMSNLKL